MGKGNAGKGPDLGGQKVLTFYPQKIGELFKVLILRHQKYASGKMTLPV